MKKDNVLQEKTLVNDCEKILKTTGSILITMKQKLNS